MASPQKENGYVPVANEIYEAFGWFRIPGECRQVLDVIIRNTYGFNKKQDAIANSQLVKATKMKKQNVSRSVARLVQHNVVIKTDDNNGDGCIYGLNKDYEQWLPFVIKTDDIKIRKRVSSKLMTPVIKTDVKVSSEVMDTKDKRHTKDILQKTEQKPKDVTQLFFDCVVSLKNKTNHPFQETFKQIIEKIQESFPGMPKGFIWTEVQDFTTYWIELSQDGKRSKWQMQKTFQVGSRLATWLRNSQKWQKQETIKNRRGRGVATED